jgi:hypothetical protein
MIFDMGNKIMALLGKILMCTGLSAVALGSATSAHAANFVLDFGNTNCSGTCTDGSVFSQTYGDQPGLDISYRSMNAPGGSTVGYQGLQYWNANYGDLNGVVWGGTSATTGVPEITFALTGSGTIRLNSLDYAGWPNASRPTSFRIYDLSYNLLFNSGTVLAPGTGHSTIAFNTGNTSGLRLQWGPDGFNGGIDNLSFSLNEPLGAVPEPATWLMMIAGFGLVGAGMRRRATKVAFG